MRIPTVEEEIEGINMTPVIDVVFLLLIFFLVASQFSKEERDIGTRLPQVVEARPLASGNRQIIVNVNQRGEYIVAGQRYNVQQLAGLLQQETRKNPDMQSVQIRGDERVPLGYVAHVMALCEQQHIKHAISVERLKESPGK
jgi:biopolymer transport protein ExbD